MSEASVVAFGRRRYSDKEKAEFRRRFIRKQRYQVACLVPLAGGLAGLLFAALLVPATIFAVVRHRRIAPPKGEPEAQPAPEGAPAAASQR